MSSAAIDTVRAACEAIAQGDTAAIVARLSPDIRI
jgi:hypothetical protein